MRDKRTPKDVCGKATVTQKSLQNSSLGKISVSLRVKVNIKVLFAFFGVCAFVLSATELMKCSSDYVVHNNL